MQTSDNSFIAPPSKPLKPMTLAPFSLAKRIVLVKFCDQGPASPVPEPPCTEKPIKTSSLPSQGRICSENMVPKPESFVQALTNGTLSVNPNTLKRGLP